MKTPVRFPRCAGCGRYRERAVGFSCCPVCATLASQRDQPVHMGAYSHRMMAADVPASGDPSPVRVRK